MSKYNNVNPGQYKVAGRERPNTVAEVRQRTKQGGHEERLREGYEPTSSATSKAALTPPALFRRLARMERARP